MKKIISRACAVFLLFALSSCSLVSFNQNDLLRAPALNSEQAEMQKVLAAHLGEEPHYKFPKEREHRTPFLIVDLDGDGENEGLLFYTLTNSLEVGEDVFMAVLEKQNSKWVVLSTHSIAAYIELASVEVASFFDDGTNQIMIGLATSNLLVKTLVYYEYRQGQELWRELRPYTTYFLGDFTGGESTELVFTSQQEQGEALSLNFYSGKGGEFKQTQEETQLDLNPAFADCRSIKPSKGSLGERLLVVDGKTNSNMFASEIFYYSVENKWFYSGKDTTAMLNASLRPFSMLQSIDIDDDDIVEVPILMDDDYQMKTDKLAIVSWRDFSGFSMGLPSTSKAYGVYDDNNIIFVAVPIAWEGDVIFTGFESSGEWTLSGRSSGSILLRVVYSKSGKNVSDNALELPNSPGFYLEIGKAVPAEEAEQVQIINFSR